MEKKYTLTDMTIVHEGHVLYRIRALKNFGAVKAGELGGWIESESNLSHEGDCWIYGEAKVYGDAIVSNNAIVSANAQIYNNSRIWLDARISGNAKIYGFAEIYERAFVCDTAEVFGKSDVSGNARIFGNSQIFDNAEISGDSRIANSEVSNVKISGDSQIANGIIKSRDDIVTISNLGDSSISFYKDVHGDIMVCNPGDNCLETLSSFYVKVKYLHKDTKLGKDYEAAMEFVTRKLG